MILKELRKFDDIIDKLSKVKEQKSIINSDDIEKKIKK